MNLYLGIDSGGTKTKFILINDKAETIAESTQSASHYLQVGLDGLSNVMRKGLDDCLTQAEAQKEDIKYCFASVAGYGDIEKDNITIEGVMNCVFNPIPLTVGNDIENAYAGALASMPGIVVIAGTGSIGLGIDEFGNSTRCGGWHHAFGGDEGSAFWIGCKLIQAFTLQSDGREPKTLLYSYLKEKYHFDNDSDILQMTIVDWDFDRTKIASLAQDIDYLASQNDPSALSIYAQTAFELSRIIIAIKKKLKFEKTVHASYQGGVFKSRDFVIEPLKQYLEPHFIQLIPPITSPDMGSALLALKYGGVELTPLILANLGHKV
jgi:N-acetylglucosamine kinase-like BadF-type ATPase